MAFGLIFAGQPICLEKSWYAKKITNYVGTSISSGHVGTKCAKMLWSRDAPYCVQDTHRTAVHGKFY
jgi:hypothetical protein